MIVLGLDPGTQRTGYSVIEIRGSVVEIREIGFWDFTKPVKARPSLGTRLEKLSINVRELLAKWNPHLIGFEKAVAFKNISSALVLSEARGVIRLAAYELLGDADARLVELSPTSVKKESAGFGLSDKAGVRRGLGLFFRNLESITCDQKLSPDAFDALAIAWTAWVLKGRYRPLRPAPPREL